MGLKKKIIIGSLLGLTALGTIGGSQGGLPPLYNKTAEDSYGIKLGFVTYLKPGTKHYGLNLGLINFNEGGTVNGLNIGCFNIQSFEAYSDEKNNGDSVGKVNGLEISFANFPDGSAGKLYAPTKVNGLRIGLFGNGAQGNVFQIGVYNYNCSEDGNKERPILGVNWRFD
ncbi:hypothetical protein HYT23_04180 [Candidatus Pacearchaeota archaeon]|nr:hypothetical protein [Candidatus Pacearchaeota archaeon]